MKRHIYDLELQEDQRRLEAQIRELILSGNARSVRLVWEVDTNGETAPARFRFEIGGQGEPCFGP